MFSLKHTHTHTHTHTCYLLIGKVEGIRRGHENTKIKRKVRELKMIVGVKREKNESKISRQIRC